MIHSWDFDRVVYLDPRRALKDDRPCIENIIGLDTEAYTDGQPFMICTSLEKTHTPDEIPDVFFSNPDYINVNFMCYNIKYDSGAVLYHLPLHALKKLWEYGSVKYPPYRYKYIPHKALRIYKGKLFVTFWDIAQYYRTSLDNAASKYLGAQKIKIRTKRFTRKYVKRYWRSISRYCIQDAKLTRDLSLYFVNKLLQFGITPTTLYSSASISFKYYCNNSRIVTVWKYWNNYRDLLKFACDAYEGGKFEVTARGHFTGYEYDLTSAYPYEVRNLVDIRNAQYLRASDYQKNAIYGFLRVKIENPGGVHLPCGVMLKQNVRIYPAGTYYLTITKEEYDYICTLPDVKISIIDGVWLFVNSIRYPYRKPTDYLFSIKDQYKNKDIMLYNNSKIALNGFYGKCVQAVEILTKNDKRKLLAGAGWNPIYGAIITANTRIKVTHIQNLFKQDCYAVHTDSVILKNPLPSKIPQNGIGKFEYVTKGDGYLIACGLYQIAEQCAFKGFRPESRSETWKSLLYKYRDKKSITYKVKKVESWIEAMAKNHDKSTINVFETTKKVIDFNADIKRKWSKPFKGKDFLNSFENSLPRIYIEDSQPDFWN